MRVRVLFFGILREAFGAGERWFEAPGESCSVGTLLEQVRGEASPEVQPLWPQLAVAVNREYARANHIVYAEDEVALLPPVSGGGLDRVLLTQTELSAEQSVRALKAGQDGAVVVFDGIVRDNTRGRPTQYLFYEAYEEMALEQMQGLLEQARERFAVRDALLHHRLGRLEVGETSVLIAVASAHRAAAFEACQWLIDTLKQTVPIWKKEYFADGAVWTDGEPFPAEARLDAAGGERRG